jgi:hypothetical protein
MIVWLYDCMKLPSGWNCQWLKGRVLKKKFVLFVLPIKFWFFTFVWLHALWSNCKVFYFFNNYYKVHSVEVWSHDPPSTYKNNSSSLILTNLEFAQLEACLLNLRHVCSTWFGSEVQKTLKKEDHLIFINFEVKKFTHSYNSSR